MKNSEEGKGSYFSHSDEWKSLAAQAQKGDKRAYRQLLKDIVPFIRSRLSGGLSNPDWIDDITQDALISVHKSLHTYSPDRPFTPWLMSIVNFRRTDFLRTHYRVKENKESAREAESFLSQNVTKPSDFNELKDIEGALSTLPDKQKKIFIMMKIEGYSAKEVAEEMDMTVSAVKVSAHRTAGKLKEILG